MGSVYTRPGSGYWWISYYVGGEQRRESARTRSKRKALELLRVREGRVAEGEDPGLRAKQVTLAELAEDLITDYRIKGQRTLAKAERNTRYLLNHFGHKRKAIGLTGDAVRDYIAERQTMPSHLGGTISNATINRELATLKRMYHLAVDNEKLKRNHIPTIKTMPENNARSGFFSYEDMAHLRNTIPPYLRNLVTAAFYTGMRKGELLNLQWEQVDLEEGTVYLTERDTKNKAARSIPLGEPGDELYDAFQQQRWDRDRDFPDCAWVFFSPAGGQIKSFRAAWATACKETGLEGRYFHDFRRSALRRMVRHGVPDKVAMTISGHKTRSVFDRYNIVSEDDKRKAIRRVQRRDPRTDEGEVVPFRQDRQRWRAD